MDATPGMVTFWSTVGCAGGLECPEIVRPMKLVEPVRTMPSAVRATRALVVIALAWIIPNSAGRPCGSWRARPGPSPVRCVLSLVVTAPTLPTFGIVVAAVWLLRATPEAVVHSVLTAVRPLAT